MSTNATNPDRMLKLECDPISAHQVDRSWQATLQYGDDPEVICAENIYLTREHWGCLQAA
jgi:hypothetical protein